MPVIVVSRVEGDVHPAAAMAVKNKIDVAEVPCAITQRLVPRGQRLWLEDLSAKNKEFWLGDCFVAVAMCVG